MAGPKAFYSLSEAARRIEGVSRADLANLIEAGKLRFVILPGRTRRKIDLDDALAAIEALKQFDEAPRPATSRISRRPRTNAAGETVVGITELMAERRRKRQEP